MYLFVNGIQQKPYAHLLPDEVFFYVHMYKGGDWMEFIEYTQPTEPKHINLPGNSLSLPPHA